MSIATLPRPARPLRSPYPYFGGKSKIAATVWARFGDVRNFVDPFFGSGALLLGRPTPFVGTETVNDYDGFVCNFWRATQAAPARVAKLCDWPVNELDLHARHSWLVNEAKPGLRERLRSDPGYYDAKIAAYWCWGLCQWIGSGWCEKGAEWEQLPHLGGAGMGIHRPSQQLPNLGPYLNGINIKSHRDDLTGYFKLLSDRLRGVRVCCGDWERVCGPTPTVKMGLTAVVLDPPYSHAVRDKTLYAEDHDVSADVRAWCIDRGDDPRIRVALFGYAGDGNGVLRLHGWSCVAWKARGGYASQGKADSAGKANAHRERVWFSPYCLPA